MKFRDKLITRIFRYVYSKQCIYFNIQLSHLTLKSSIPTSPHSLSDPPPDADPEPDPDSEPDPDLDPDLDGVLLCDLLFERDLDLDGERDLERDGDFDADLERDGDFEGEREPDLDRDSEPERDADLERDVLEEALDAFSSPSLSPLSVKENHVISYTVIVLRMTKRSRKL